ncbi:MAG: TIGR02530 family flagellar biosynthesis protein [bacterium]
MNPAGLPPVGAGLTPAETTRPRSPAPGGAKPFAEVLQQQLLQTREGVKFSAHAQERLRLRSIELSQADLAGIDDAVKRAAAKGARESLVLSDKAAFVVSVRNRTVITVVDAASMKENVFTNIDSAVLL